MLEPYQPTPDLVSASCQKNKGIAENIGNAMFPDKMNMFVEKNIHITYSLNIIGVYSVFYLAISETFVPITKFCVL